eukprot:GGOE01003992.1.p1 GENE.GGOE01003992.1~~GGOE01003992.1.p1  ORF type:complete len:326 (+),score=63.89 GGOE01003992.1:70-978(+)
MPHITLISSDDDDNDEVVTGPGWNHGASKEAKEILVACLSNRAAVHLKMERQLEAITDCSRVIGLQPSHAKAVFRRAQAYETLANKSDASEAKFHELVSKAVDDTQRLVVLEPTNKEAKKALQRLRGMLQPAAPPSPAPSPTLAAPAVEEEETDLPHPNPVPRNRLTTCELCRIAGKLLPAPLIYEDNLFVVLREMATAAAATHHFVVAPRVHMPTVDKLLPRHAAYVQHMEILANRVLQDHGADLTDALIGFHLPPFVTGAHLYLHAISPASQIGRWNWNVKFSRLAFLSAEAALRQLHAR